MRKLTTKLSKDEVLEILKKSNDPDGMRISEIHEILSGSIQLVTTTIKRKLELLISDGLVYQSNPGFRNNRLYKSIIKKDNDHDNII